MHWTMGPRRPEFKYLNDTLEQVISYEKSEASAITSKHFTRTNALFLARYENDKTARDYIQLRNAQG